MLAATQNDAFDNTDSPAQKCPDWMSRLDDGTSLARLSIPGTHDTMTYGGHGGSLVKCQSWPLDAQLEAGIRFLDIRCRHFHDELPIHHGAFYQHVTFNDVLSGVTSFLDRNPREAVVMRVKKEYKEENNSRSMVDTFNAYTSRYDSKYFWTQNQIPSLGEARGKIVFLDDFANGSVGIDYKQLSNIADDYTVRSILPGDINKKWSSVEENIQKASRDGGGDLFLTYASGTSAGAHPYSVAWRINPKLLEFFNDNPGEHRWGIVVMDFPGAVLVQKIKSSN